MTTRVVHCKRAPFDVYIGRPGHFGNPFTHKPLSDTKAEFQTATVAEAIARYAEWVRTQPAVLARLPELRGKILGCWCTPRTLTASDRPYVCHGQVLAAMADAPADTEAPDALPGADAPPNTP